MAIQTLNSIKNWFKTSLKPSQQQFWDTWDSFRHKFEKVPVKDIEGIDELLLTKADKTVLDNHLADKNAHAPQVNTDWNSESGFSQLINKPEFKTINGEEIVGEGDITVSGGDSQDLQSILDVNNRATQGNSADGELTISMSGSEFEAINQRNSFSRSSSIIRNNAYYLQLSNYLQPSSGSANNISAQFRVEAGEASIEQSINGFNGQNTVVKFQKPERKDVTLLFPAKRANGEYIIATLDDITGGSQNLQQVLDVGKTATYSNSYGSGSVEILGQSGDFKFNEFVTSGGTTDKTYFTQLPSSVGIRSQDLSDGSEGNVRVSYGKPTLHRFFNGNSMFVELQDPIASNTLRFPAKSGEDVTYDIATTDDITLQKALENGAIGTLDGHIKLSSEHGDGEASLSMAVSEQLGGGSILQDVKLTGTDGIRNSRLSIMNGRMNIFTGNELGGSTSLDLEAFEYVNSTNFSFPDVGGNRVIATTDDFKTINGESIIGEGDIEIGGSSQNLQQVLDSGNTAQQGTSSNLVARYDLTELGLHTLSTKRVDTERSVSSIQNLAENLYLSNYYSPTDNITDAITSKIDFNLGNLEISQNINGGSGQNTKVRFETPLNTDVNLLFPTKNQNGTYKLATTDDILPKISRISDDFTIPDGYATRFITVLAINKTITLPNVTDSVGAIFYITGNPLGNTIINCKNRNLQILYQGNLESDYEIQANNGVTLINDGTNYIVTSKYP